MKYVVFQRYLLYQLLFSVVPGSVIVCVHVCVCLFVVSVHVFVCVCPCAETCLGVASGNHNLQISKAKHRVPDYLIVIND